MSQNQDLSFQVAELRKCVMLLLANASGGSVVVPGVGDVKEKAAEGRVGLGSDVGVVVGAEVAGGNSEVGDFTGVDVVDGIRPGAAVGCLKSDYGDRGIRGDKSGVDAVDKVVSWADEVESSESSVELPARDVPVGSRVRSIKFGRDSGSSGDSFWSLVKSPIVQALLDWLYARGMRKVPKQSMQEFALAVYTAGTVPAAFISGQRRLRAHEFMGDAVLTMLLADYLVLSGASVAGIQTARSEILSNSMLAKIFVESGLVSLVIAPAGVDVKTAKVGANAVETLFGVVYRVLGLDQCRVLFNSIFLEMLNEVTRR